MYAVPELGSPARATIVCPSREMPQCVPPSFVGLNGNVYVQSAVPEVEYLLRTTVAEAVPGLNTWIDTFVFVVSAEATWCRSLPIGVVSVQIAVGGFVS